MNAREVIAQAIATHWDRPEQAEYYELEAEDVLSCLTAAGFVILPRSEVEALVEKAFRDGLTYGTICKVTDVDEAWRTSSVYAAIRKLKSGGE